MAQKQEGSATTLRSYVEGGGREYKSELDRIETAVDNLPIPLGFADQLYELRQHIELARHRHREDQRQSGA